MKLIIAEKPSLGRNIVSGISGKMVKKDGYFEGDEYIVTWAFGHLFSLEDIEHYSPENGRGWSMDNIPCFPSRFDFSLKRGENGQVDSGVTRQFNLIKTLCSRPDVSEIINAGDADREGEIIVRLIVSNTGCSGKKLTRLWLNDQTPETVASELKKPRPEEDFDTLAAEGMARTYTDWLYGVNLTRYATLRSGSLMRVGRVIVPIVRAIYDRDLAIESFVPDIYYVAGSSAETKDEKIELNGKEKFPKEKFRECGALCDRYNTCQATVISIKRKKTTVKPGKLFSLSTLQNLLGKKFKMSMSDSLEIIQGLYEKGYLTYPRTNSEYLSTAEKSKIRDIISSCIKLGYPLKFKDEKTIFDDSKIESHSAITPTYKIPKKTDLSDREYNIYSTVFRRFAAVFCAEDCIAEKTEMVISVGGLEDFALKGNVIVEKGWMKYDDGGLKDRILPQLNVGDTVNISFSPVEKETTPPKHYTIETLNNYLKNPFKEEKQRAENEDDSDDYRAMFEGLELGTEATRTGIIDNARQSGYIKLTKDVYTIEPNGRQLIETLEMLSVSMDKYKTAEIGKVLKKILRGESTVSDCLKAAEKEIRACFEPLPIDRDIGFAREKVGSCPLCGKDVVRNSFSYGCSGYRDGCKFRVPLRLCGRSIPKIAATDLLASGRTKLIEGFTAKNGKSFDSCLILKDGSVSFDFQK